MPKAFEIDFIRQIIIQTLQEEYIKNPTLYIGNDNQIRLTSFYEHLASDEEVDRYVETVRDLIDQQNRTGLIANGTILTPENPTITNINQCTIIPLSFTINIRCTLADRDIVKASLDNVVRVLKGRKVDIAELDTGKLFKVGVLGNNAIGKPLVRNGDFIGTIPLYPPATLTNIINNRFDSLALNGFDLEFANDEHCYLYFNTPTNNGNSAIRVAYGTQTEGAWTFVELDRTDNPTYKDIIFPTEHTSIKKYCVSLSFDSFRCSEPRTLNAEDYCDLSFGGSATIVSNGVVVGNQLTKLGIMRSKVVKSDDGSTDTIFTDTLTYLEPLEMPSGNASDTQLNQLVRNNFINNTHTNALSITNQYTFIVDENIDFLHNLYKYGRFGNQDYFTPNIIFSVREIYSKWGVVDVYDFNAKMVDSIDIENTESDVLTITLPLQIQGDYN